ncbi:MAG: GvpL/GvpF family gas vesicle protein, partial [Chloroflexota bacterium]
MDGIYLYGIVEAPIKVDLVVAGVDGSSPVHIVAKKSLGCVVSDYSGEAFTALSKEQIVRRLLAHQWVVERVMEEHTVLPVKFGTILDSPQDVLDLLSQGRSKLGDAVAAIRDKAEIEVAATWDTSRVLREIGNEEDVVRAKEAIARTGQPAREDLVRVGQMVKAHMDKRREGYRERMVSLLRPLCVDLAPNALVSDDLVMNVAFLVDRSQQAGFDAGVQRLDKLFQNEVNFRVVGPLPPYTFSTVEVTRLTPELVDEARRALRLGDVTSEAEVTMAYRRMAAAEQRNLERGSSPNNLVAKLKQASDVLLRYCRAQREA